VLVIGGLIGVVVACGCGCELRQGAFTRDRFLLKAPAVGRVIERRPCLASPRVLGTLVYGGVPILEALQIAGLSTGNLLFQESAREVEQEVRAGRPIAEAMRDTSAFPPVLTHMVAIGEETGNCGDAGTRRG
jgi:type II secretory pathway component PulF